MNNNCEYANQRGCLCSACQSARKAMEEAENISKEEIDRIFAEAEEMSKEFEKAEGERT